MSDSTPPPSSSAGSGRGVLGWISLAIAAIAVGVVLWAALTEWGGIVYGHPAYGILLIVTVLLSALGVAYLLRRPRQKPGVGRRIGRIAILLLGVAVVATIVYSRPNTAVEPAITAMESTATVTVTESPVDIVLAPAASAATTGVFFQPGALVDARAYTAVLAPLADAGYTVVIAKQPLGIAFFSIGAFDAARSAHPEIAKWVIGGHSLGGTVAAIQADAADGNATPPAAGLFFFASYPASDISESLTVPVLSISGSEDGLATPAKIDASRTDLPADTVFNQISGASHAQFGSYGLQSGDGTPTISDDAARAQMSQLTIDFVSSITD